MEDSDLIAEYAIGSGDEVGYGVPKRFRRRHVLFVEWFDGWTGFVSACVLVEPRGRRRRTHSTGLPSRVRSNIDSMLPLRTAGSTPSFSIRRATRRNRTCLGNE